MTTVIEPLVGEVDTFDLRDSVLFFQIGMRNKIKHVHNVAANRCINYRIDSQLCSIYILDVFDFVAVKSFFRVFAL